MEAEAPELLSLRMLKGTRQGLADPHSILLSASLAESLFGDRDPLGRIVKINNKADVRVTGVYMDIPHNSSFNKLHFIVPWELYTQMESWVDNSKTAWGSNSFRLFIQSGPHADFEKLSAKIKDAVIKNNPGSKPFKTRVFLHPMSKWKLYSEFKNGVNTGGFIQFVWMFGIIGAFVLLLACINFMNLSTARSEKRAKEVGIRKSAGSLKSQLVGQFMSESVLTVLLGFGLAVLLATFGLPWFNELADKKMSIPWGNISFWLLCGSFIGITGFISGSYPAFYLSSFQPVKVLKGTFRAGRFASAPCKILVVLQFTVSVTLIIGTIVVFRQIQHAKDRSIGYTRERLIDIPMSTPDLYGHYDALRSDLLETGAVENMAQSSNPVTGVWSSSSDFGWKGKDPNLTIDFGTIACTHDFGRTIGWNLVQGRDFSRDFSTDSSAVILNEAAAKFIGFENPVNKKIEFEGNALTIIGVIEDMVMSSPFEPVKPTVFLLDYEWANIITVKIASGIGIQEALAKIEMVFNKYNPGAPFDFTFSSGEYARKFLKEERIGKLSGFFAILAIFISCLGILGLASFAAEQRTKEIGIRKVLGATILNVWGLLSKDFIRLVGIAFLIAAPAAYYLMTGWLERYEYRTEITWWIFLAAGIVTLLIALLTISYQAIKAAATNPVKSLRSDV